MHPLGEEAAMERDAPAIARRHLVEPAQQRGMRFRGASTEEEDIWETALETCEAGAAGAAISRSSSPMSASHSLMQQTS